MTYETIKCNKCDNDIYNIKCKMIDGVIVEKEGILESLKLKKRDTIEAIKMKWMWQCDKCGEIKEFTDKDVLITQNLLIRF